MDNKMKCFLDGLKYDGEDEDFGGYDDIREPFEFMDEATNVYRTKNYIVKQCIVFSDGRLGVTTVSNDVFYERTPERDDEYEEAFGDLIDIDGRRVPAMGYIRKYVK